MTDLQEPDLARLRWRCRRGMRELDAVLQAFLRDGFALLSAEEKSRFEAILELPDPLLYGYLAGQTEPTDRNLAALIGRIRASLSASA